jgi:hypothetical protein
VSSLGSRLYAYSCAPGASPCSLSSGDQPEQALRLAVVHSKVGGIRTLPGAKAQGILGSALRTCEKQAKAGLDFVSQSLRAFGT